MDVIGDIMSSGPVFHRPRPLDCLDPTLVDVNVVRFPPHQASEVVVL